jgi:hypothetical protein
MTPSALSRRPRHGPTPTPVTAPAAPCRDESGGGFRTVAPIGRLRGGGRRTQGSRAPIRTALRASRTDRTYVPYSGIGHSS